MQWLVKYWEMIRLTNIPALFWLQKNVGYLTTILAFKALYKYTGKPYRSPF